METTIDRLLRAAATRDGGPISRSAWPTIRGLLAIALGIGALLFPTQALFAFTLAFAAFAFIDGLLSVIGGTGALRARHSGGWVPVLRGLIGIAIGALFALMPYVATLSYALASLALLAVWSIFTGLLEIAAAMRLRHYIRGEWLLALSGLLSILLGLGIPLFLTVYPEATLLSAAWMIGAYALTSGALLVAQGIVTWRERQASVPLPA